MPGLVLLIDTWICWITFRNGYSFGRCLSDWAELVSLPYCLGILTFYSYSLHDFSVITPSCFDDVYINSGGYGGGEGWCNKF